MNSGAHRGETDCIFTLILSLSLSLFLACRIKIVGVDLLQPLLRNKKVTGSLMLEKMGNVFVEAAIYHGGEPLSAILTTKEMPFCCNPRFQEWLNFGIKTKDIPKVCTKMYTYVAISPVQ